MRYATALVPLLVLFALACGGGQEPATATPPPSAANDVLASYSNSVFKVDLVYPASWVPDPNYGSSAGGIPEAYKDPRGREFGYFYVNALCCPSDLDVSARDEASHKLKPYGGNPRIEPLTVDGRDARLILPDEATAPEPFMAELVVPYRRPVPISGPNPYTFFIMYAHKDYIRSIAEGLRLSQ